MFGDRSLIPSGTPGASDWGNIASTVYADPVRWAYQAGLTCASTFDPDGAATRRTAASWIYRLQHATSCGSTETQ